MCGVVYRPSEVSAPFNSGFDLTVMPAFIFPVLTPASAGDQICRDDYLVVENSRDFGNGDLPVRTLHK